MTLDVVDVDRFLDSGDLIEFLGMPAQRRIIRESTNTAFEMDGVDAIKPNERGKEPPVGLRADIADQIGLVS